MVKIAKGGKLPIGEFVDVEITGSSDHDLEAKVSEVALRSGPFC